MIHFVKTRLITLFGVVHQTNLVIAGDGKELQVLIFINLSIFFRITLVNRKQAELVYGEIVVVERIEPERVFVVKLVGGNNYKFRAYGLRQRDGFRMSACNQIQIGDDIFTNGFVGREQTDIVLAIANGQTIR